MTPGRLAERRHLPAPGAPGRRWPGAGTLEILVNNGRVAERIVDPTLTSEIHEIIERGEFVRDADLRPVTSCSLVKAGIVSIDDAFTAATNAHDFELALRAGRPGRPGLSRLPEYPGFPIAAV